MIKSLSTIKNYRVSEIVTGLELSTYIDLSSARYMNSYFVKVDKVKFDEPKLIRENIDFIRYTLTDKEIYVLELQSSYNDIKKLN